MDYFYCSSNTLEVVARRPPLLMTRACEGCSRGRKRYPTVTTRQTTCLCAPPWRFRSAIRGASSSVTIRSGGVTSTSTSTSKNRRKLHHQPVLLKIGLTITRRHPTHPRATIMHWCTTMGGCTHDKGSRSVRKAA
jgi:hypothetical protein